MHRIGHWAALPGGLMMAATLLGTTPSAHAAGRTLTMEATAYGPSAADNYPYGPVDYFGQPLTAGDIAVDPTVIPLRECLYVTGYHNPNLPAGGYIGEADDEGGAIKGMHVDLFMNANPTAVSNFGIQTVHVTILGPAANTSLSGTAACAAYASALQPGTSPNPGAGSGAGSASSSTASTTPASRPTPNQSSTSGLGANPAPTAGPVLVGLTAGMTGHRVDTLEADLKRLGYSGVRMNGLYDRATAQAVTAFEREHQLPVGGATTMAFRNDILQALLAAVPGASAPRGHVGYDRGADTDGAGFGRRPILVGLAPGMDGRHVYTLQADLQLLGYTGVRMTGVYDRATLGAVLTFETQHGLVRSGSTTMAFRNAILEALGGGSAISATKPSTPTSGGVPTPQNSVSAPSTPTPVPTESQTSSISTTARVSPSKTSGPMILGYYVPGAAAWADLMAHASQMTAIAPFWYSFTVAGPLRDLGASSVVTAFARAHDIAIYPMVINGYGNDHMWSTSTQLQTDVAELANLALQDGYSGFTLDFEGLNNPDATGLTTFVRDLAAALHREGKKLIVSVGPRTAATNAYHVYNYAAIGQAADYVDLMLYDAHDNGSAAGPVAPMSWVTSIVHYAESTIAPGKILVGLAGYGYNWAAGGATEISDAQALALQARYGSTFVGQGIDEARITYTGASGATHTVWFEDSTSEAYKVALVTSGHLGGVALWDLGEENPGVWPMLQSRL